jgi:hypothetical protein
MTGFGLLLHASCIAAATNCEDTVAVDLTWWILTPLLVVGVVIIAYAVKFVRRGR